MSDLAGTAPIVLTLKGVMASKGMKLTQLSELSGVPYRSLQNYFSRRTEMPASVYLKLCATLGLDPQYSRSDRFELDHSSLTDAIVRALGHLVPTYILSADASISPAHYTGDKRSDLALRRDASMLASILAGLYDQGREIRLRELHDADEVPE